MGGESDKFSPILKRIVTVSVLLTLAAQIVLLYIGLAYADSIDNSITRKRSEEVLTQFQQNILYQMNDVSNLLLLLQSPEFSGFFNNLMNLRDEETVSKERRALLDKLNALEISPEVVSSVYFIGENFNQQTYRKRTGSPDFEELPHLREELLRYAKLDSLFLPDHDQFVLYTGEDFKKRFRTEYPLLEDEDIAGLKSFVSDIQNRFILTNGSDGVFIVIVLNDRFFELALPEDKAAQLHFSVVRPDNRVLWSSAAAAKLRPEAGSETGVFSYDNVSYTNTIKELLPYRLRIVFTEKKESVYQLRSPLLLKLAGLSMLTLLGTLLISLFYLKKVFMPFRIISRKIKSQSISNDMVLRSLPEDLVKKGFQSISLLNKLILVLIAAVIFPTISDGILYSRFSAQEIERKITTSVDDIGHFSVLSIRNRVRYIENIVIKNIVNEISVSQTLQNYAAAGSQLVQNSTIDGDGIAHLTNFPGLNDFVSYFILLDNTGKCIYSSIYSNNKEIFDTNSHNLLNVSDPYWISNYKDVFRNTSTAVLKRISPHEENAAATYLLLVPRESVFENMEPGLIHASISISDREGQKIYRSRLLPESNPAEPYRFSSDIPDTNWRIAIDYVFNEVIEKNRVYQEQFLLCLFIVLMLSVAAAIMIANILVRPIKQLKKTMLAVGAGDLTKQVDYAEENEIGDIIRSYNRMIGQLDQIIKENMNMMEENAANKIRENNLISMKTKAELQMLQAQINPHFLYNTLEAVNIRSMKLGNHEIGAMVTALADLFRYSVAKGGDTVELDKELNHAANYVTIEQIRFGHSFEVEFDVPEELRTKPVLRFILQPIIENSIKHGFAGWESGGLIRIAASQSDDAMRLVIRDNGVGMNKQALRQLTAEMERDLGDSGGERSGIGLKNVYYRLKLFYRDEMSMTITSEIMKGTEIVIRLPI